MTEIAILLPAADISEVKSALSDGKIEATAAVAHGFDGADVVSLVVTLTPPAAIFLASLYATREKAKRYTVFRYKGLEIKGVSEAKLTKLAERAMADVVKKRR